MSTINDSDLLAIERSGTLYQVRSDEMSTLNDTDLFVVERSGVQYKVEASDIDMGPTGTLETPVTVLTPLNGAGVGAGVPYNPISSPITTVSGGGNVTYQTSSITSSTALSSAVTFISHSQVADNQHLNIFAPNCGRAQGNNSIPAKQIGVQLTTPYPLKGTLSYTTGTDWGSNTHTATLTITFDDNTTVTNTATYTNSNTQTVVLDGTKNVKKLVWTLTLNTSSRYHRSWVENVLLDNVCIDPSALGTEIAFSDSTNFEHFNVGDSAGVILTMVTGNFRYSSTLGGRVISAANSFQPDTSLYSSVNFSNYNARTYLLYELDVSTYTTVSGTMTYSGGVRNVDCYIWFRDGPTGSLVNVGNMSPGSSGSGTRNWSVTVANVNMTNPIFYGISFEGSLNSGQPDFWLYYYPAQVDGLVLAKSPTYSNAIAYIQSVDTANSKIVTNGGSWAAGDTLSTDVAYDLSLVTSNNTNLDKLIGPITISDSNGAVVTPQTSAITSVTNNSISGSQSGWTSSNGVNLYNGTGGTAYTPQGSNGVYKTASITFSPGLPAGISALSYYQYNGSSNSTRTMYVTVNYADGTSQSYTTIISGGATNTHTVDSGKSIQSITWSGQVYNERVHISQLKVDNTTLNLASYANTVLAFTDSTDFQYFQVNDVASWGTIPSITQLDFEFPSGWSQNAYITGVYINGKLLTDWSAYPSNKDEATQIDSGTATSNGTHYTTDWANGVISTAPNANSHQTKWRPVPGSPATMSISWTNAINIESLRVLISQNSGSDVTATVKSNNSLLGYLFAKQVTGFYDSTAELGVKINAISTANSTMTLETGGTWATGDYITADTLNAGGTTVLQVSGNTVKIVGGSGQWYTGLNIKGATITDAGPHPSSIVFTSSNGGTTAVTGTNASLASRVWRLETASSQSGPWTLVSEYVDYDATSPQNGSTQWSGKPTLSANTFYRIKVTYTSDNAAPVASAFNTFRAGAS